MNYGINGYFGKFNNNSIYQTNNTQNAEVKKAETASNEVINFSKDSKELGLDLLTKNTNTAYGIALKLSAVDKNFTEKLSDKEKDALQNELNKPGVSKRIGDTAIKILSDLEDLGEFV